MKQHTNLKMEARTSQRMAMLGRMRMADWIEMPESQFAREIEKIEKDPLFRKLYSGTGQAQSIIRRQRWPSSRFSSSLFEMKDQILAKGEPVQIEETLERHTKVVPLIKKIGSEAFERYFLYGEEPLSLEEIASRTGIKTGEAQNIQDFLLEIGAQAEFSLPQRGASIAKNYSCLARLYVEGGETAIEFYSPYWARGLYHVRYEHLNDWKSDGVLSPEERRRLPRLLKRLETVNLRQNTLYRVLECLSKLQFEYLSSQNTDRKFPISLRRLARRLDLAPSTVSRALSGRSVKLPWNEEIPLSDLVPGRRNVMRDIISRWLEKDAQESDSQFAARLRDEYQIRISRRTVNAVRNELKRR